MTIDSAIDQGKLVEYLGGINEYQTANEYGNIPTSPETILFELKPRLSSDPEFRLQFISALVELSRHPENGWVAAYHLIGLYSFQKSQNVPLVDSGLLAQIGNSLKLYKAKYQLDRSWTGAAYENGIWGDLIRLNDNIRNIMGYDLGIN